MNERELEADIKELAGVFHWQYYHTWRSIHSAAGFPDVVMVRGDRVIFAELKSEKAKVSPRQQEWLDALTGTGKVEVYLFRPENWDRIVEILR